MIKFKGLLVLLLLLFVIGVVSTQSSPITLIGNKAQLHCVINDTSKSAVTFVGDDFIEEPEYVLPENICLRGNDPFACISTNKPQIKEYTNDNSTDLFAGHLFDRRWESFRLIKTSNSNNFSQAIRITGDFKIGISVRIKENAHIHLCNGTHPPRSHCYWFILDGWVGQDSTRSVMRRCADGVLENTNPGTCKEVFSRNISGLTSLSKWSHFRIEMVRSVISLYKFGDNEPVLTYNDSSPIQFTHVTFRSPRDKGFWKHHHYNFMEIEDHTIITANFLPLNNPIVCVSVYLKLCHNCMAEIRLLDGGSNSLDMKIATNFEDGNWTEKQLVPKRTTRRSDQFTLRIIPNQMNGQKWYLGEILDCAPNGLRKITTNISSANEICCYMIKSGQTICKNKDIRNVTIAKDATKCPSKTFGQGCIPCSLFGSCNYYKYCEFAPDQQIQCHCPRGFTSNDCSKTCKENFIEENCKSPNITGPNIIATNISYFYLLVLVIVPISCACCLIFRKKCIVSSANSNIFQNSYHYYSTASSINDWPLPLIANNDYDYEVIEEASSYSRPVMVKHLNDYIKTSFENGDFEKQFVTIPQGKTKPWTIGAKSRNDKKNRDANIIAYDHTRVKLSMVKNSSDYINANYIKGCNGDKTYIAAQAPVANTINDFWRMIWHEDVKYVIVLATEMETKMKSITIYWPDRTNASVLYGDIAVKFTKIVGYRNLEERTFQLVSNGERKTIIQYHFLSWTKNNIFNYISCLTSFLRHTLEIVEDQSPILVHCTDGVGRTGIFILAHICLQIASKSDQIDVLSEFYKLREQRVNMVNPVEGYKLVHMLLLRSLVVPKTAFNCDSVITYAVTALLKSPQIRNQLSYIESTLWQDKFMLSIESRKSNSEKHVDDDNYVFIDTCNIDGYRTPNKFIVTPYPLDNMIDELWQIIIEKKIRIIVCLNELLDSDILTSFYPNEESPIIKLESGIELYYNSQIDKKSSHRYHIQVVTNDPNLEPFNVILLQFRGWFYDVACPADVDYFLTFQDHVNAVDNGSEPILIACRDGIRASGFFTAMYFLIQQIKCESRLDVPLAVRIVKLSKKEFIRDLEQFKFLYKCCLQYLSLFDAYSNYTDQVVVSLGDGP